MNFQEEGSEMVSSFHKTNPYHMSFVCLPQISSSEF